MTVQKKHLTEVRKTKLHTIDIKSFNRRLGYLGDEVKGLHKRFDSLEELLIKWKSELFTKIDNSYAKPIRDLQEESAAQHARQNRQQKEIDKIRVIALNQ